jgi:hypothetical protein
LSSRVLEVEECKLGLDLGAGRVIHFEDAFQLRPRWVFKELTDTVQSPESTCRTSETPFVVLENLASLIQHLPDVRVADHSVEF